MLSDAVTDGGRERASERESADALEKNNEKVRSTSPSRADSLFFFFGGKNVDGKKEL